MNAYHASASEMARVGRLEKYGSRTADSRWYRRAVHVMRNGLPVIIMGFLLGMFALVQYPVQAQQAPITCTSTQISPPVAEGLFINPASVVGTADGRVVYLVSDYDANISTLFRVAPDDTITEVGQIRDVLGTYSFPRWKVDVEAGNVVYTSYVDGVYTRPTTIMMMDLTSGEQTAFMGGVNEYDFGRAAGRIWWSSNAVDDPASDYGFYLYDPATDTTTAMRVPKPTFESWAFTARLMRVQPNGDVLFTVTRMMADSDRWRTAYYRGDSQTGTSDLLYEEEIDSGQQLSYASAAIALDDRLAYVDADGEYIEIDFEGDVLRTVSLHGPGVYRDLSPTPTGMLFTYADPDKSNTQDLYHVSNSGVLSTLTPAGEHLLNLPPDIALTTTADGTTTVWFNTGDRADRDSATLYAYRLPADDTVVINEPDLVVENVSNFSISPAGAHVVASVKREAVLIDTATLAQTATGSDYDARAVFFDGDEPHVADGRVLFVDPARDIVYFTPKFPQQEGDDYVLYAAPYDGVDPVRVDLPEVNVPSSLHWHSFNLMPNGDVVYFGEGLKSLYRARCQ